MGLDGIFSNLEHTPFDIARAFMTEQGEMQVSPPAEAIAKVEQDVASWGVVGRGLLVTSGITFFVSWIVWGIPFVGFLAGSALALFALALGTIGYDALRCSLNLQPFTAADTGAEAVRGFNISTDSEDFRAKFNRSLFRDATQYTVLGGFIYQLITANGAWAAA